MLFSASLEITLHASELSSSKGVGGSKGRREAGTWEQKALEDGSKQFLVKKLAKLRHLVRLSTRAEQPNKLAVASTNLFRFFVTRDFLRFIIYVTLCEGILKTSTP